MAIKEISLATMNNLVKVIKGKFERNTEQVSKLLKNAEIEDGKIKLYTNFGMVGDPAFTINLPNEQMLNLEKTEFIPNFAFDTNLYPTATNPGMDFDGKPVMVLAINDANGDVKYSFINLKKLVDTYKGVDADDKSASINISAYEISGKVNISEEARNGLILKDDGLYVLKFDGIEGATENNVVTFNDAESMKDSLVSLADMLQEDEIFVYTKPEIAALFNLTFEEDNDGDIMLAQEVQQDINWDIDGDGDVMPSENPQSTNGFEVDGDGDIMPQAA